MKKIALILVTVLSVTLFTEARCYTEKVGGLDRYGDNFLSIRTGPSTKYRIKDTLHNGDAVGVCEHSGKWKLVYYGTGQCYLKRGEPIGDCKSGWAYGKYLR